MFTKFICFVVPLYLFLCQVEGQLHIECVTPNNETATCEAVHECKVFINSLKNGGQTENQKKFMKKSLCGFIQSTPIVCCGTKSDYNDAHRPKRAADFKINPALPDDSVCGISIKDSSVKGSTTAGRGEFPWSARLQYNNSKNVYGCQGSLIDSRYILTSGLCLEEETFKRAGNLVKIRLGDFNCPESEKDCKKVPLDVGVAEIIRHPNYGFKGRINHDDIGLVRLEKEIAFSDTVRPICLPKPGEEPLAVGELLTESGWYKNSKIQLKAENPLASFEDCSKVYSANEVTLTNTHICAGGLSNGTCAGTSGGSLIKRGEQEKAYLEGVISFGPTRCGFSGWPTVYTNVRPYLEWIHSSLKPSI